MYSFEGGVNSRCFDASNVTNSGIEATFFDGKPSLLLASNGRLPIWNHAADEGIGAEVNVSTVAILMLDHELHGFLS